MKKSKKKGKRRGPDPLLLSDELPAYAEGYPLTEMDGESEEDGLERGLFRPHRDSDSVQSWLADMRQSGYGLEGSDDVDGY